MEREKISKVSRVIFMFLIFVCFKTDLIADPGIAPQFKNYPTREVFTGKNAPVKLERKDLVFKTRLRRASKQKPDFAGHYIFALWGCGAECLMGGLIDAKTGKIYPLPFTLCCWYSDDIDFGDFEPIEYRIDSRLIIFTGMRDEKGGDNGKHYYIFDRKRFVHLHSQTTGFPKKVYTPDSD